MSVTTPVSLFYSYAHEDEEHRKDLEGHLKILERRGLLQPWHDRKIVPSQEWNEAIDRYLNDAELVLLLVSKDFIASDYIWGRELKVAMARHETGAARVVPILVRAVDIEPEDAPFMKLQGLPTNLRPVTSWPNVDEAWTDVAKGLRATVNDIRAHRPVRPPSTHSDGVRSPAPEPTPAAPPAPRASSGPLRRSLSSVYGHLRALLPSRASGPGDTDTEVAPGGPSTEQPVADDPLLERVVDAIAQKIVQANVARGGPPLDAGVIRGQVLSLIDTPEQKRVLWVDDRPQGNALEIATLAKLQVEVVTVRSTDDALQRIDADSGERFDLVISDWERRADGREAGLALAARLRSQHPQTPLVFYHGEFGPERRAERARRAREAGALGEAVVPGELLALVLKAFG